MDVRYCIMYVLSCLILLSFKGNALRFLHYPRLIRSNSFSHVGITYLPEGANERTKRHSIKMIQSTFLQNSYENRDLIARQVIDVMYDDNNTGSTQSRFHHDMPSEYIPNTYENRNKISQEVVDAIDGIILEYDLVRQLELGDARFTIHEPTISVYESIKRSVFENYFIEYDISSYNGEELQKYGLSKLFQVWQRLIDVGAPIFGWWFSKYIDDVFILPYANTTQKEFIIQHRAKDLKDSIVQSRSIAIIKSGQALSLRSDIIKNKYYLNELSKLQDEVGTFDNSVAMDIIRYELDVSDPNDIFEFDPVLPIASASIGQVYKARLRSTGLLQ